VLRGIFSLHSLTPTCDAMMGLSFFGALSKAALRFETADHDGEKHLLRPDTRQANDPKQSEAADSCTS